MCRQFLVPPFQILGNQNWKNWPGNYMGRLWILRDVFLNTRQSVSVSTRLRANCSRRFAFCGYHIAPPKMDQAAAHAPR